MDTRSFGGLNAGYDMMGNALTQPTDLCLKAVVNPNFEPLDLQLMKIEKKIEAGAEFFQLQAIYDPKRFDLIHNDKCNSCDGLFLRGFRVI